MITALSRRLVGQPDQQALADELRSLIAARVVLLRDAMARSMDPNGDDPVQQATHMERAREVAEAITATTDELTGDQRRLLAAQNVAMQRAWRGTLFGLSLCGICLAICVALVVLLRAAICAASTAATRSCNAASGCAPPPSLPARPSCAPI
jgi:CHASE3 domain sensor protein